MANRLRTAVVLSVVLLLSAAHSEIYPQGPKVGTGETSAAPDKAPGSPMSKDELEKRIELIETQMDQMRQEINLLRAAALNGASPATSATKEVAAATAQSQDKPAPPARPGFDVGPVHVVPYGTIYLNLFGNSGGTNNSDVPLFATPTGAGGVSATARETRLGMRLDGPQIVGAKTSAVVETDFSGGFPAIGIGEDFGVLRIRLAYLKLDWKATTLVAGQDWTIFSPNNPVSIASVGAPEFAGSGNLFGRIPQIRLQHRWLDGKLSWDGAVLGPRTGDFPPGTTPAVLQPGSGAASRMPAFETRIAINNKNWFGTNKAGSVGFSGHYGRARVATTPRNIDLDVEGVAGDWNMPFGKRVTLAGEAFWGRNLAGLQGDVFQTFVPDFAYRVGSVLVPGGPRAPATAGGWTQIGFTPATFKERLTIYASGATDDPKNLDFVSLSKRDSRIRNRAYAFSFIYKFTPQLLWGLEYRRLETLYIVSGQQNNNHLNLTAAFNF